MRVGSLDGSSQSDQDQKGGVKMSPDPSIVIAALVWWPVFAITITAQVFIPKIRSSFLMIALSFATFFLTIAGRFNLPTTVCWQAPRAFDVLVLVAFGSFLLAFKQFDMEAQALDAELRRTGVLH
jgi:hypothetical protein